MIVCFQERLLLNEYCTSFWCVNVKMADIFSQCVMVARQIEDY